MTSKVTIRKFFIKVCFFIVVVGSCSNYDVFAVPDNSYVSIVSSKGCMKLSGKGKPCPILISSDEAIGVQYAVKNLQADITKVTGKSPAVIFNQSPESQEVIIIGTLGCSTLIDKLVSDGKMDVTSIKGKWEAFLVQMINNPFDGVDRALVITGSDKRGTIYGIYDLSEQIGVSPWYWWADVPVLQKPDLYVAAGFKKISKPAVKYRGIFINDEAPALSGWAFENFGGFNHLFYEHVFELILRLKGNYLWPAMWGSAFYDDDSLNAKLADEYGIVIGTSHHEPLMRAHDEWRRYGSGPWNYEKNEAALKEFWTESLKKRSSYESIITVGMRGDGDEPMTEGTAIALLEKIVADQRNIISEVTGKDPATIPQVWALYKEVQDYYDLGMRVPDDITLLLCDDNWGNVRRLPTPDEPQRIGGYGMYYHFDFVGGPRNYKWLNTNQIARIWEQMHFSYEHGVDRIWIVNVGDIKPMEYPIHFFLDYAWDPDRWKAEDLPEYARLWAKQQFGETYAARIAGFLNRYTMYNSRKKPEMLSPETYSLNNYREAERIVDEYNSLAKEAKEIQRLLPAEMNDAYYQLVMHPIEACANLNNLYVTVAKNRLYRDQLRVTLNDYADAAEQLYRKDAEITYYYNHVMSGGKWNHMMDQTHIGYTNWQQPDSNSMPKVLRHRLPSNPSIGVAIENYDSWWPKDKSEMVLPTFDRYNKQEYYIDLFSRGSVPIDYRLETNQPWIHLSEDNGKIEKETRIIVSIDWLTIPYGKQVGYITVKGINIRDIDIRVNVFNPNEPAPASVNGFIESNGYVSIEAEHYANALSDETVSWQVIPGLGRTLSGVTAMPVTAPEYAEDKLYPRLEYPVYFFSQGDVKVNVYISPSLNYFNNEGLKYGISIDDEPQQIVFIHKNDTIPDWRYPEIWNRSVSDNIRILTTNHKIDKPGQHVLKIWMVTPGVVLQKIVIDAGGVKPSYLGPPESYYRFGSIK